jgi:hypothetical protein
MKIVQFQCDICKKVQKSATIPLNWIQILEICDIPYDRGLLNDLVMHFCSWDCLDAWRLQIAERKKNAQSSCACRLCKVQGVPKIKMRRFVLEDKWTGALLEAVLWGNNSVSLEWKPGLAISWSWDKWETFAESLPTSNYFIHEWIDDPGPIISEKDSNNAKP